MHDISRQQSRKSREEENFILAFTTLDAKPSELCELYIDILFLARQHTVRVLLGESMESFR